MIDYKKITDATARIDTLEAFLQGIIDDQTTLNKIQRNTHSIKAIVTRYFDTSGQQ